MTKNISTPAARLSLKVLDERMARLEAMIAELGTQLQAPAKVTPARTRTTRATTARKAAAKKASPKAASRKVTTAPVPTKGSLAKGAGLTRSQWNKTLTAKARLAGKREGVSVYSRVIDAWDSVQADRAAGVTPDEVLAKYAA